ncbi:unnamed protein product, partial [Amoebophrya sp. A120]
GLSWNSFARRGLVMLQVSPGRGAGLDSPTTAAAPVGYHEEGPENLLFFPLTALRHDDP